MCSDFRQRARTWYFENLGVAPHLGLSGPLLLGLEKEQPQDLFTIFYRVQLDIAYLLIEFTKPEFLCYIGMS